MPLLARTVATPVVIDVRRGAVSGLASLLADGRISTGGKVAVAVGPGRGDELSAQLDLPDATVIHLEAGTLQGARALTEKLHDGWFDAVVGIGGGKTLDTAKYSASMAGLPFVAVATNLSHDGIASPVASLVDLHGRKQSYGVHIPIAVFVDIDHVQRSPQRMTRAGLGDVLSNLNAVADWLLGHEVTGERVDGLTLTLARSAAESLVHASESIDSESLLTTLADALILSGIAMAISGTSRPCSGACHEISHALDELFGSPGLHGEQVAVGALFALWLRGDERQAALVDGCARRYALPRTPLDLGLTVEQFTTAVLHAPNTRPDRFTILEHLRLDEATTRKHVDAFIETFAG
jgi:glycerol-1-phosphate dehydrogenase [NAD(P)+]